MYTAKVSSKGWIVIPKALRTKYDLKSGAHIQVVDTGKALLIIPLPDDPVEALHGMLKGGPSLTADLLAERAKDREREESLLG